MTSNGSHPEAMQFTVLEDALASLQLGFTLKLLKVESVHGQGYRRVICQHFS